MSDSRSGISRTLLVAFCAALLLLPGAWTNSWAANRVGIIYPELSGSYQLIFQTIIDGIKSTNQADYRLYPLPKGFDQKELKERLERDKVTGIIALGKRGYLAAKEMALPLTTVAGALPLIPNGISGISLSADPDQIFSRLKTFIPETEQVLVVYSPKSSGWLIPFAEAAAKKHNLKLTAYEANDLRETMHHYRKILQQARGRKIAIWLPLDRITVNDDIVLPMLLQEAWDKNLVICSSKPTHVQRGALFSMFADNYGLGQELAKSLQQQEKNQPKGVKPLSRLQIAVNMRTAAHLGLNFSSRQQQTFNLTFPAR